MPSNLSKEELSTIIQWDVKNWSKALDFWEKHADIKPDMKVLALGEREGGLSLYFAKKGCEVVCSDYNPMPDSTKKMHEDKGVSNKISYAKVDMKAIDFEDNSFDLVVFKSVIGALGNKEDQLKAIKEISRVLKPGGKFLFAENAEGSRLHTYLRKRFIKWGEGWRYIPYKELEEWKKEFSSGEYAHYGFHALFGRSERQRRILSVWDATSNWMTPKKWRYIHFGAFVK